MRRTFSQFTRVAVFASILAMAFGTGCSTSSKNSSVTASGTTSGTGFDNFTSTGTGAGTGIDSLTTTGTGSGTGGLTELDKTALQKAISTEAAIEPTSNDSGLSAALQKRAQDLLAAEAAGKSDAAAKIALAGEILKECAAAVVKFAPMGGMPLMGGWVGGGACAVSFTVGAHAGSGKYPVTGGTQGTMQADQRGVGAISGDPFSGNVVDSGLNGGSGAGTLTHPTFFKTKNGATPCSVGVTLQSPTSPIPANYREGMLVLGKCYRQALIYMSSSFGKALKSMDPATQELMKKQFLGIGK